MKVMSIVGARPNFMKVAPIIAAIWEHNSRIQACRNPVRGDGASQVVSHVLVHTGQHYDQAMSGSFFADLGLPFPDYNLGVGSGTHAAQTAEIMRKFEEVLLREQPDVLIVVGDVNSTLACALVAAKVPFDASGRRPLIAHVEAGLRSFDRTMPEEVNRILTDHLSDLLFVTEESGIRNLEREGVSPEKVHFVGNTMIDSVMAYREKANNSTILRGLALHLDTNAGHGATPVVPYALLTLHRPANVDDRETFLHIIRGLEELSKRCVVIFAAHPRTRKKIAEFGLQEEFSTGAGIPGTIRLIEPLGYLDFLCLLSRASLVVTDSGGIQEETTCLGVPCVTVRENTERPITVESGTNTLAGIRETGIREAAKCQFGRTSVGKLPKLWDGKAGARIVEILAASPTPQPRARTKNHGAIGYAGL